MTDIAVSPDTIPVTEPEKKSRRKKAKTEVATTEGKANTSVSQLKATCQQSLLAKYVPSAIKAVSLQATGPLQYLRITADMGTQTLKLGSFDQSKGIEVSIPANVEQGGSLLCRPQEFSNLVQRLPDTPITLLEGLNSVTLLTAISRSEVLSKSDRDYPKLPEGTESRCFTLDGATLQRSILKTIGCVHVDETKGVQNGVNFQLWRTKEGAEIATCATNTQVLALYQTVASERMQVAPDAEFTISAKVLRSLIELAGLAQSVEIRVGQSEDGEPAIAEFYCTEKVDDCAPQIHKFVASLVEGQFISYRRYIPQTFKTEAVLDRELFLGNLERAMIIADHKKLKTITLSVDPESGELDVFTEAEGIGSHQESLSTQIKGEPMSPLYSCKELLEIVKQISGTEVRLQMPSADQHLLVNSPTQVDFLGMVASKVAV